jgi:hypothetical protein
MAGPRGIVACTGMVVYTWHGDFTRGTLIYTCRKDSHVPKRFNIKVRVAQCTFVVVLLLASAVVWTWCMSPTKDSCVGSMVPGWQGWEEVKSLRDED